MNMIPWGLVLTLVFILTLVFSLTLIFLSRFFYFTATWRLFYSLQ